MYTGDDFNYPELMPVMSRGFPCAVGDFDPLAVVAAMRLISSLPVMRPGSGQRWTRRATGAALFKALPNFIRQVWSFWPGSTGFRIISLCMVQAPLAATSLPDILWQIRQGSCQEIWRLSA